MRLWALYVFACGIVEGVKMMFVTMLYCVGPVGDRNQFPPRVTAKSAKTTPPKSQLGY